MWFQPQSNYIKRAWGAINRADFVPKGQRDQADLDQPLPIGLGQTISQPSVVAFMLELLNPQPGGRYLDIGSGSGWTTALLAHIAGKDGHVWAIEIIPELKEWGQNNVRHYGFEDQGIVEFIRADGSLGYAKEAPFDGILVSASADQYPIVLQDQLKIGGRLVIPVDNQIWQVTRKSEKDFQKEVFPDFVFVPLRSSDESKS